MTDTALLSASYDPGLVPGYGTVAAGWARQVALGTGAAATRHGRAAGHDEATDTGREPDHGRGDPERRHARRWIRRLYVAPGTSELVAMDSRSRTPPPGLADLIRLRDADTCRIHWCDAPGRHLDHATPHADGGPTSAENLQLVCEAHNYATEAPGWSVRRAVEPTSGAHTAPGVQESAHARAVWASTARSGTAASDARIVLRTPSGATCQSLPPPLPGSRPSSTATPLRVGRDTSTAAPHTRSGECSVAARVTGSREPPTLTNSQETSTAPARAGPGEAA